MFVISHFSTLKMMIRTTLRNTNQQKMHFSIFMVINVISSIVSKKKKKIQIENYYLYMRLQVLPGEGMRNSLINII